MSCFKNITLTGTHCRLEPLVEQHLVELKQAIKDGELWKLMVTSVPHPNDLRVFLENAESSFQSGEGIAFATIDHANNTVVGSTRFMNSDLTNKRVEIGYTFLAKSAQRTAVNSEAKLLMMSYAFETLKVNRVELKTDYLNTRSRDAILRLGAKEEGILRNHVIMKDGRVRDTVMFSVLRNEWPGVKQNLEYKLSGRG